MNYGNRDQNGKKWEDYDYITCMDGQVIDMNKLLDDQQRAKAALVHIQPFFGAFINKLKPIYTFRVATQATDGVHLFINPQFTYNMDLTEKVFVLAHEIMHCVLNHLRRARNLGHDPKRSNVAADYECNITIAQMDLIKVATMKKLGALVDEKFANMGYETIYDKVGSQSSKDSMDNSDGENGGSSSGNGGNSSGSGSQKEYSQDYKDGWKQAIEDYKNGKLKL